MLTVSTELQPILNGIVQFISYMVLAVFAENVILARALGVTRLMKLVPDHRAQVWDFCLPLLLVITLSAPAGWAAHDLFFPWLRDYLPAWLPISALRPIVYLTCGIAAMAVAWLLLGVLPRKLREPELYDFAKRRVRSRQRAGLCLCRLYRSGGPPPSAQQGHLLDLPGSAQLDDLRRRAVAGDLRPGWPHRCSVTVRGSLLCPNPAFPQPIFYCPPPGSR